MLKLLSLFSGLGAFEKALTRLHVDYDLVNFCEIDKYASKAYCAIHGVKEDKNLGDITKVDETNLPNFDLMSWGFPCTDISIAGKQKGFIDENGNQTRSGLYYEGLRILKYKKPKYSIIENVKALTQNKFKTQFEQILKDLEEAGYNNYYKVLNSKHYGIPQSRDRIYIISIRKDIDDKTFEFPKPFDNGLRLKDFLESNVDEKYYISEEKTKKLLESLTEKYRLKLNENSCINTKTRLTHVQNDGNTQTLLASGYKEPLQVIVQVDNLESNDCICVGRAEGINGHDYIKRVYSPDGISPTIVTGTGGNHQVKIVEENNEIIKSCATRTRSYIDQPESLEIRSDDVSNSLTTVGKDSMIINTPQYKIRKLTPKETMRLQGFDDIDHDNMVKAGISNSRIYKCAGNSITVHVLEELFKKLFKLNDINN